MFKHATCLTLALIALLELSSAGRVPRSIWPFSSASQPAEQEGLIPEKHAEILRQNGYGEYLDLSSHPLWKIHKYEGIDLRPVKAEAEIIKSPVQQSQQLQQEREEQVPQLLDARNPVSSVAPLTESQDELATEAPDLSFLDNLGGLAYFLPDDEEETEKASEVADAIANEEQSHPGFFARVWSILWGSSESAVPKDATAEGIEEDSALVHIALPKTKGMYADINVIQPIEQRAQLAIQQPQQPVNPGNQYSFTAGANVDATVAKPVAKWYKPTNEQFGRSHSWVQSWNPHASYNVHVQGPADNPAEHVGTVQVNYANAGNDFQRKVSVDEETVNEQESDSTNVEEKNDYVPSMEQMETVLNYTTDNRNEYQRILSEDVSAVVEQRNVTKVAEAKVEEAPILANIEPVKEEAANASDDSSTIASGIEDINHTTQRIVSEDEQTEKVVAVTEGQVQQVAAEQLESSTVAGPQLKPTLRQKAVNALKMGLVPQRFLRQLQLSEQEIDDFMNNREGSNKTWDKIRGHLNKLSPLSPRVRKWFFV